MIQWMIVHYPRLRDVFIDGLRAGMTEDTLPVREGTQRVHLGTPMDYDPPKRKVKVTDTTEDAPKEVSFEVM
jgi:hypothetical protein